MKIKDNCLIEIYTRNNDSFSVGKVFCQNDDEVIFTDIDAQGKLSGYFAVRKSCISCLEYDTDYLNKI